VIPGKTGSDNGGSGAARPDRIASPPRPEGDGMRVAPEPTRTPVAASSELRAAIRRDVPGDAREYARWASRKLAEAVRIIDDTERRQRRAVWDLLCGGQAVAARTMAEAMGAPLPAAARVAVVACGDADPDAIADLLDRGDPPAWVVRSPGDAASLVALLPAAGASVAGIRPGAPSPGGADPALPGVIRELTRRHPRTRIGVSPVVDMTRVAVGYAQARHALSAAGLAPEGYARFCAWLDPELLMARQAAAWADGVLAPLARHEARRRSDPDGADLLDTLDVWLATRRGAGERLGIHRNTLSGRLRLVERLAGRDLARVDDRAELSLALRVHALVRHGASDAFGAADPVGRDRPLGSAAGRNDASRTAVPDDEPHRLPLGLPALQEWAHTGLRPLGGGIGGPDARTLRVWLDHDARLAAAASALSLSVPGARKRLVRIGGVLGLDLLHAANAEADLWLAFRVADRRLSTVLADEENRRAS
jgi:hypothetical protein